MEVEQHPRLNLQTEIRNQAKFCVPEWIMDDLIKVVGKFVLDQTNLSTQDKSKAIRNAIVQLNKES